MDPDDNYQGRGKLSSDIINSFAESLVKSDLGGHSFEEGEYLKQEFNKISGRVSEGTSMRKIISKEDEKYLRTEFEKIAENLEKASLKYGKGEVRARISTVEEEDEGVISGEEVKVEKVKKLKRKSASFDYLGAVGEDGKREVLGSISIVEGEDPELGGEISDLENFKTIRLEQKEERDILDVEKEISEHLRKVADEMTPQVHRSWGGKSTSP